MPTFAFRLLLAALTFCVASPAFAQKIIEKNAAVAAGQRVVLNLKHANTIRIRQATDNQLRLRATVNINQNKLNDALLLSVNETTGSVTVTSELSKEALAAAQPGDCPSNGGDVTYYGSWNGSNDGLGNRAGVCTNIIYDISLPAGTAVQVSTISGNIEVTGLTGSLDAKSISGFVDVSWPPAKAAAVALKTITGEVYTDQEVAFENRKEHTLVGYQLRGALASGNGPLIKLESISGNVFFRKPKQ